VRRTAPFRAVAVIFALLAGGSGAGFAVAHGWAHAEEHHGKSAHHDGPLGVHARHPAPAPDASAHRVTADDNDARHGHADVGAALRGRGDVPAAAEVPARVVTVSARAEQTPISAPRALLVRAHLSSGPPPPLRSPPRA